MKRIIIFLLSFIIIITMFFTSIMALDRQHIDNCDLEDCARCIVINYAINFIKSMSNLILKVFILIILSKLAECLSKEKCISLTNSLIKQKAQFNE